MNNRETTGNGQGLASFRINLNFVLRWALLKKGELPFLGSGNIEKKLISVFKYKIRKRKMKI